MVAFNPHRNQQAALAPAPDRHKTIENFGGNIRFHPQAFYTPRDESEILQILGRHRTQRIRAVGRLHSWSNAANGGDVVLDLRKLNAVEVRTDSAGQKIAEIGAGCQVRHALDELLRQGNWTLPSVGLITEQAVAGAIATGTHGSGRNSLSHYVQSLRIAGYDPVTGEPVVRVIDSGPELQAARCSLGSLGVVTSVTMPVRPSYYVEEHLSRCRDLQQILDAETEYNLQQFFLVPWQWSFFAQHRREVDAPRSRSATLYRLYWALGMDRWFHTVVIPLARWLPRFCTRFFFRRVLPSLVPTHWKVVDRSDRQLTMQHQLFRHIEIEMFVQRSNLPAALDYVTWLLKHAGGEHVEPDKAIRDVIFAIGDWDAVQNLRGRYVHHYPICIRKVLPDDTLISMASGGDQPWYAISFISYVRPQARQSFFNFANVLARTTSALFGARPHWGKINPLDATRCRELYPRFDEFCRIRAEIDPDGRFLNDRTESLFGSALNVDERRIRAFRNHDMNRLNGFPEAIEND